MIKILKGTVFNAQADAMVNTVNCDGFMEAGLALEFRLRYPNMYEKYKEKCKKKEIKPGRVEYVDVDDEIVINFPTKNNFRFPSRIKWISEGLDHFLMTYKDYELKSVAFPKLGSSHGGLDWNDVKAVMKNKLSGINIDIYICLDENKEAEGVERKMIEVFNSTELLRSDFGLTKTQLENIERKKPFKRFREIKDTKSIGIKTYEKLYKGLYKRVSIGDTTKPSAEQLKLPINRE